MEGTATVQKLAIPRGAVRGGQLLLAVSEDGDAEWDALVNESHVVRNNPGTAPVTASVKGGLVFASTNAGVHVRAAPATVTPTVNNETGAINVVSNVNGVAVWGFQSSDAGLLSSSNSMISGDVGSGPTLLLRAPNLRLPDTAHWHFGGVQETHYQRLRIPGSANQITNVLQLMPIISGSTLLAITTPNVFVASAVVKLRFSGFKMSDIAITPTHGQMTWQLRILTTSTHHVVEPAASTSQTLNAGFVKFFPASALSVQGGSTTLASLRGFKVNYNFGASSSPSTLIARAWLELNYPSQTDDPLIGFKLEPVWA